MTRPVALVTGASRGIGRASASALAVRGFDVVVTARTLRPVSGEADGGLAATVEQVRAVAPGAVAHPLTMDLLDRASVDALVPAVLERAGRLDLLLANAIYQGPGPMDRLLDVSIEDADAVVRADYLHQLVLIRAALVPMLEQEAGTVVVMSSGSAHLDPPAPAGAGGWGVAYAAAKAAVTRVVPVVHVEFAGRGIRAFNVDPGFVVGERMRATGAERQFAEAGFQGVPPEVPAAAIAWLATDPAADELRGTMVFAQRLAKDRALVPGWPPPRPPSPAVPPA